MSALTIAELRRYGVARSLGTPSALRDVIERLRFVQADPIRSPARAHDLTLRHRVAGYRAGDLEAQYRALPVEEDFFVNYGFVSRSTHALMHPRGRFGAWPPPGKRVAAAVLALVRERGEVHPRDVSASLSSGTVTNYWGGSSSATTHALDHLHYRGLVRVCARQAGIRLYAPREPSPRPEGVTVRRERIDRLIDHLVALYAPVPAPTLAWLVNRLRWAVPQWAPELPRARARAMDRMRAARVSGTLWYWPAEDDLTAFAYDVDDRARFLTPFDPIVWDRRRFAAFWGWEYRFEAYTPAARRRFGYYAMPLLWRDRMVGWGNLRVEGGQLKADVAYASGHRPRDRAFSAALDAELIEMRACLRLDNAAQQRTPCPSARRRVIPPRG